MPKPPLVTPERQVRLFRNGRNQAVRIPREFEFSGEDAILREKQAANHRARPTQIPAGSAGDAQAAAGGFSTHP